MQPLMFLEGKWLFHRASAPSLKRPLNFIDGGRGMSPPSSKVTCLFLILITASSHIFKQVTLRLENSH